MIEPVVINALFADGITRQLEIVPINSTPNILTSKKKRRYLRRMKYLGYQKWCKSIGVTPRKGKEYYRAQARKIVFAMIKEDNI